MTVCDLLLYLDSTQLYTIFVYSIRLCVPSIIELSISSHSETINKVFFFLLTNRNTFFFARFNVTEVFDCTARWTMAVAQVVQ